MPRKIAALITAICILMLSGCMRFMPKLPDIQQQPQIPQVPLPEQRRIIPYFNGYLGLTVNVDSSWMFDIGDGNGSNLSENAEDTSDISMLEMFPHSSADGYEIPLIDVENGSDPTVDNHARMYLYADYFPTYTGAQYYGWMQDYITSQSDGEYTHTITGIDNQTVNGHEYARFLVNVSMSDGSAPYIEEYYILPVNELYFVAYINYWDDSAQSRRAAYEMLNQGFAIAQSDDSRQGSQRDGGIVDL